MPLENASASAPKSGAVRFPLPIEPCERRRDCEISKADAAPGSVGYNLTIPSPETAGAEKRPIALFWFSLLVILPLVLIEGERIAANISPNAQKRSSRLVWYVHSGQWLADIRTIGAACQLMMEDDAPTPNQDNSTTNQVVGSSHKKVLPGSELQDREEIVIN